jgi:redox-sensitive bicupin YhaK (pirin superfamily)
VNLREIERIVPGQDTSDGAGVRLKRSIGTRSLDHVDPFLLFDEFKSDRADDYIAGFPDHPHRGFETVTYMLAGRMEHRDHAGNQGNLLAGSVQWMTAGRGIIHSEMPQQEDGLMWGFQLWVNLPSKDKMTAPRYQDIPPEQVPEVEIDGGRIRIVAGQVEGTTGPIQGITTNPTYLDVHLDAGSVYTQEITEGHSGFLYVYAGSGRVGITASNDGKAMAAGTLGILGAGDGVQVQSGNDGIKYLIVAAKPIREPIARYGPFVMTTPEELEQAFADYRAGTFLDP